MIYIISRCRSQMEEGHIGLVTLTLFFNMISTIQFLITNGNNGIKSNYDS